MENLFLLFQTSLLIKNNDKNYFLLFISFYHYLVRVYKQKLFLRGKIWIHHVYNYI